ncbi:MAG: hypothetical protein QMD12_02745 [Candidatus Aenigmarchaeota archaeon]|nr:hypothetical protein [Candidatus Aenigmarchaeota archaeon]
MGLCIWGLSWLACGIVGLFKWIIDLFAPGIPGPIIFFVALGASSLLVYLLGILLGRAGGILLSVVGILGALLTAGTTLILTLIGVLMAFLGKPKLLVLLNLAIFAICAACYGIG